jgi:hypothetical protein
MNAFELFAQDGILCGLKRYVFFSCENVRFQERFQLLSGTGTLIPKENQR